jgi:hypothetical protein
MAYSVWSFGIFFTFWYVWTKKNLAALIARAKDNDLRREHRIRLRNRRPGFESRQGVRFLGKT